MNIEEASKILQVISDQNRLTIIMLLTKKNKMSGSEFLKSISCKQSTLSHHLNEMVEAGLLKCRKQGNKVFYSINTPKYTQLLNFLGKAEQEPKAPEVKEEKKEVYRVVDSDVVKPDPVKIELPIYLL